MNKYLEKAAKLAGAFKTFKDMTKTHPSTMKGVAIGATAGGAMGYLPKTYHDYDSKGRQVTVKKTKAQRVTSGVVGAVSFGYLGGRMGHISDSAKIRAKQTEEMFRKARERAEQARKSGGGAGAGGHHYDDPFEDIFKRYRGAGAGRAGGGYGGGGAGAGGRSAGNQRTSRTIHDIHKDLGFPSAPKTKAEAKQHFRRMASKHHPDKHEGAAAKDKASKDMAKINRAWDEFNSHPEGFTKLANEYLEKIAAKINFKKIQEVAKANPGAVIGGVLGGTEGYGSTLRLKRDNELKFRLRQLKNTTVGAAFGAGTGKIIQEGLKKVSE